MSNKDSFLQQLPSLLNQCRCLHNHKKMLYLVYSDGIYSVRYETNSKRASVVKEPYQFVPSCCVMRWYGKALHEAHHRLSNLLANDNTD